MKRPILISNTYFLHLDPKQERRMEPYPPLGTLYAAAVLRDLKFEVHFFDTIFCDGPEDIQLSIAQYRNGIFVICDDGFNYLTKMCLVNMREACFQMIRYAKDAGYHVVVSSSDATDHWQQYLDVGADAIIVGEAEQTLAECVSLLHEGNTDLQHVDGLALKINGNYIRTAPRKLIEDLDTLPMPAWDMVDMEAYRSKWLYHHGYFSLNMTTTRGCPFKCNWCAKPIYGNRYHSRSAAKVAEEMHMLRETYHADHIWFCDDIFGLKPNWITSFAEAMQHHPIPFKIQCRADLLLNENNIKQLALAGCDEVWIGAESGSQKILDAMDKGTTINQIETSAAIMHANGIKPCFFLQFGYPGETDVDIHSTLQMVKRCKPYDIGISISYPLPGTVFYNNVKAQLSNKQNWSDSDELLLMYQGTYSPQFYKILHRYVHRSFRMRQGWQALMSAITFNRKTTSPPLRRIFALPLHATLACVYYILMQIKKQPIQEVQVA